LVVQGFFFRFPGESRALFFDSAMRKNGPRIAPLRGLSGEAIN
jgi:hypothetical protein